MEKKNPPWLDALIKRFTHGSKGHLGVLLAIGDGKDIVRFPMIKRNYLVNNPQAIYRILVENVENYTKENTGYSRIAQTMGYGVLTNVGEAWRQAREEFQPQFHLKKLAAFVPVIHQCIHDLFTQWRRHPSKQTTDINNDMLILVMNISAKILLGINLADQAPKLKKAIHVINDFIGQGNVFIPWLPTLSNLRFRIARNYVDNFLFSAVQQQTYDKFETPPLLASLFVKNSTGEFLLPKEKILGEIKNFFVAGHETTGITLGWLFYCLLKNPYTMTQVKKEIAEVVGQREVNLSDLDALHFCDMAIQETLRLYPPIWAISRKALHEDILHGYYVPAGTFITLSPYLIHRHRLYWQNPHHFYPERFLPETAKHRPKCTFIPFGVGPRVCIGKQMATLIIKMVMVSLIQNFDLELPRENYYVKPVPLISLKPDKGIWLKVKGKTSLT